jgi:hypothetical protein
MGPRWRTADARGRGFDSRLVASVLVGLEGSETSRRGDVGSLVLVLVCLRDVDFAVDSDGLMVGWRLKLGDALIAGERWCDDFLVELPCVAGTSGHKGVSISLGGGS